MWFDPLNAYILSALKYITVLAMQHKILQGIKNTLPFLLSHYISFGKKKKDEIY